MDDDIATIRGPQLQVREGFDPDSGYRYVRLDPARRGVQAGVVFLHGAGERGGELHRVLDYGLPATLVAGTHAIDVPVCCPHLAADESWPPASVARLIETLRAEFARIVLCGYSLGGSGACDLIAQLGTLAELTIVIAGRSEHRPADVRLDRRVVFVQGEQDDWADTALLRSALAERGCPPTHRVIAGAGHFIAETAMEDEAVVAALAALGVVYQRRAGA